MMHTPITEVMKTTTVPNTHAAIIATWNLPDRDGNYPAFVALAEDRDATRAFSTHIVYYDDDKDVWAATTGHYLMTLPEATTDFLTRAGAVVAL